ncbi:Aste57867_22403 [Aphanomyces stellatus]|uniref:Aste57867_22403 protein n=1 Tax=Aphanomyces stellatus TaxID=120398 RepID=A0A485LK96_9STRA|nr:hypothetical protein As57867_022333 [Aphanomyces stellatus]VFT99066.1 Aste57867_22403 [Aphanomyces stellatus]
MSTTFTRAVVFLNPKNENPACSHDVATLLLQLGIPDVRVTPLERIHVELNAIPHDHLPAALYVQPGGGDDVDDSFAAYFQSNRKLKPAVQAFVAGGGAYLGVCLGAYAAAIDQFELVHDEQHEPFFQFDELDDDDTPKIVPIDVDGVRYHTYHQGGPDLTPMLKVGGVPFGSYVGLSHAPPVGVVVPYWNGHGMVGLLSPHLEADATWDDAGKLAGDCNDPARQFLALLFTMNQLGSNA